MGKLCFPGGSLELNETLCEGIKRELIEETGFKVGFIGDLIPEVTNNTYMHSNADTIVTSQVVELQKTAELYPTVSSDSEEEISKEKYESFILHYIIMTKLLYLKSEVDSNGICVPKPEPPFDEEIIPGKWMSFKEINETSDDEFVPEIKDNVFRGYQELENICRLYGITQFTQ